MTKKKEDLYYLNLFNDPATKGVTTFKNEIGGALLVVIMPSDFEEWEQVTIVYKKKVTK